MVDDEINIIEAGKNYGWPEVSGYYDEMAYTYCNWSAATNCDPSNFENHNCSSGAASIPEFTAGMPVNFQAPIGTYDSTVASSPSGNWLGWPTVGPSSIDIYEGGLIPNWGESLLIPTLKRGTIFRSKLNTAGNALEDGTYEEFHSSNDRYRDIEMDPDGVTMYAITDNTGGTSGPSGSSGVTIENPGVVIKITYTGQTLNTDQITSNTKFNITPNPASSFFTINYNKNIGKVSIQIIDVLGKVVFSDNDLSDKHRVNINSLKEGIYFVSIVNNQKKKLSVKKLIINK